MVQYDSKSIYFCEPSQPEVWSSAVLRCALEVFGTLDLNNDGMIDNEELEAGIAEAFLMADANKSGDLTPLENLRDRQIDTRQKIREDRIEPDIRLLH